MKYELLHIPTLRKLETDTWLNPAKTTIEIYLYDTDFSHIHLSEREGYFQFVRTAWIRNRHNERLVQKRLYDFMWVEVED